MQQRPNIQPQQGITALFQQGDKNGAEIARATRLQNASAVLVHLLAGSFLDKIFSHVITLA